MSAHHRRRLRRIGWDHALSAADARWAVAGEPPSEGNAIEVLVDGEEAIPRIAEAIANARSHVHIAGWCVTPEFAMSVGEPPMILRDLAGGDGLARAGSGAALGRRAAAALSDATQGPSVRSAMRSAPATRSSARWTRTSARCTVTTRSSSSSTTSWHSSAASTSPISAGNRSTAARIRRADASAGTTSRPPARARRRRRGAGTSALRWKEVAGEPCPRRRNAGRAGDDEVQIVRTVPEQRLRLRCRAATSGSSRRYVARAALGRAPRLPREPVPVVAGDRRDPRDKLRDPPSDRFRVLVVLPAQPNNGADDTARPARPAGRRRRRRRPAARLARAPRAAGDATDPRVRARQGRDRRRPLAHGRLGEPQRALALQRHRGERRRLRPELARHTRLRLWAEHLERSPSRGSRRPGDASSTSVWRPLADRAARAAAARARRSRTAWWSCRTSRAARSGCSARCSACSSTADAEPPGSIGRR